MTDNQEANADSLPDETSSGSASHKKGTINLQLDNAYDLLRLDAIKGLQDELMAWGKKRFWLVLFAIAVFGSFGGFLFLSYSVDRRVDREIERYEAKFADLRYALIEARIATKAAVDAADSVKTKLGNMDKETAALETRVKEVNQSLEDATTDNLVISEDLRTDIAQLTGVVNQLAKGPAAEDIQVLKRIADIEKSLDQSRTDIFQAGVRAERRKYAVMIMDFESTHRIISRLESLGFSPTILDDGKRRVVIEYPAMYVGADVPVGVAAPVIALAKKVFPDLMYVGLSHATHFVTDIQIGSESEYAGLVMRPLSTEDFQRLSDTTQSQEEFHRLLKSFELPPAQTPPKRKGGGLLNRLFDF